MENAYILKNYMEDITRRNVEEQLKARNDVCACDHCKLDILAFALNNLPSRYVVSDRGHVFTKLKEMEFQFMADVTREVYKAIEFIKTHKRH